MKASMAGLATETNTLSPLPTGLAAFERELFRGDGSRLPPRLGSIPLIEWRRMAEAAGYSVVATFAQPSGVTFRPVYEGLRDTIL